MPGGESMSGVAGRTARIVGQVDGGQDGLLIPLSVCSPIPVNATAESRSITKTKSQSITNHPTPSLSARPIIHSSTEGQSQSSRQKSQRSGSMGEGSGGIVLGKPELRLDWCSYEAARYACQYWHYSKSMPMPPMVMIGAWEGNVYIGCVLFARGASPFLLSRYGIHHIEGAELVRVALCVHNSPVSRIVAIAIRLLRKRCPGIRLIVSFADPAHGHHGGIYQAMNWIYSGTSGKKREYISSDGKVWHDRMITKSGRARAFGKVVRVWRPEDCIAVDLPGKHRYLMPLDPEMRVLCEKLRKPYPKKPRAGSADGGTPDDQSGGGGPTPTPALKLVHE